MGERGQLRTRAGAHVHRRTGDGGGGRDPAEHGGGEVGQPLAEEFAIGVVALAHGHLVGHGGGEQALQRGQRRDREGGGQQDPDGVKVEKAQRGRGQAGGQGADADQFDRSGLGQDGRGGHPEQRERQTGTPPGTEQHHRRHAEGHRDRDRPWIRDEPDDRVGGDGPDAVAVRIGDPERGRHLLQGDDHRDAGGEPLDHGDGQVVDVPTEAGEGQCDQYQPGQCPDHQHPGGAELLDHRHQHHGHRPGRPGDLEVGAAEDGGDGAGHHRRHQPGLGPEAGGDAEGQGQRQRHHGHGQPGEQVAPGRAAHRQPVGAWWQQPDEPVTHRQCAHRSRPSARSWSNSASRSVRTAPRMRRPAASRSATSGVLMA